MKRNPYLALSCFLRMKITNVINRNKHNEINKIAKITSGIVWHLSALHNSLVKSNKAVLEQRRKHKINNINA